MFNPTHAQLSFELIRAGHPNHFDASVRGEPGAVSGGPDSCAVRFNAGCTLQLDTAQGPGGLRTGTCRIVSCELEEPFIVMIRARLANTTQPYFMIPATLYGTNNADRGVVAEHDIGTGGDPKLVYRGRTVEECFAPSWHFRADHSSVPSASATFDGKFVAVGIEEASQNERGQWVYNGLGLWTSADDGDSISITIGALDWPARIIAHRMGEECVFEPLTKETAPGMSCQISFYESAARDRFAYEPFIAAWYDALHELPRPGAPLNQAMREVASALVQDGIDPRTGYFHMYLTPEGIEDPVTLLAWAGILQITRPLIRVGRILKELSIVETAAEMVDRAVRESPNPATGLFCDSVSDGQWQPHAWWKGLGQTALINGHACYLLMKMFDEDPQRRAWAEAAEAVLLKVLSHQREDGRFPGGFSPQNGRPITYETFGGCYFAAPLLMKHRFGHDTAARDAARRAIEHYWQEFERLEWVGVDLDCGGAVDSGSSYALIRALVEQHRQDGGREVLDRIGHVLHYAFTYRFGHNTRHRNPVCDWSSSGSKVTSTHNVHLDAFGGEVLEDLAYFLQHRDDPYLSSRLADSLAWARQAYNRTENEYAWGKVGYTTEQYYHTYDHYNFPEGDGTVWVAYFPWAAGSLLNAFVVESQGGVGVS